MYFRARYTSDVDRYDVIGDHPGHLPGLSCDGCGLTWADFGASFVTVAAEVLAHTEILGRPRGPVPREQFREMASQAREVLPGDIPVMSGANYGTMTAQVKGRLPDVDFLWQAPFDVFVRAETLARLREKVDGIISAPAHLEYRGADIGCEELYFPHIGVLDGFVGPQVTCDVCGYEAGYDTTKAVLVETDELIGVPLFTSPLWRTVKFCNQQFADAVDKLGLTGLRLEPFPSRPADPV